MTIATERRGRYHHGDLRNALIDAATRHAAQGGPDAIVLRGAARDSGVSATAAYRHFANHAELVGEVKQRALDRLAAAMAAKLRRAGRDPERRLQAVGRAYIEFALTEPGLFRLAFYRARGSREAGQVPLSDASSYAVLTRALDELVAAGRIDPKRRPGMELPVWAAVHGIAVLLIDGPVPALSARARRQVIDATLAMVLVGIRSATAPAHGSDGD